MSDFPKVSVLLTCFNREDTIEEALQSVISQDFTDREILLVDDGSTDRSLEIVSGFPEVKIIRNETNQGVVCTRQRALEAAQGEYLLFVDSDNRLKPGVVGKMIEELERNSSDSVFVYGQREYFGERSGISHFPAFDPAYLKRRNCVDMTSLFRRDQVLQIGFDSRFPGLEDYDLVLSLVERGGKGVLLDEAVLEYRIHESSLTGGFDWTKRVGMLRDLAKKHRPFFSDEEIRSLVSYNKAKAVNSLRRQRTFRQPFSNRWRQFCETLRFAGVSRQLVAAGLYLIVPGWTQKPVG